MHDRTNKDSTDPEEGDAGPQRNDLGVFVAFCSDKHKQGTFVPVEDRVVVGREGTFGVTLPFDDRLLSRNHAMFVRTEEGLSVEDQGSTNGTFVDGARISGPRALSARSVVRVGHALLVVCQGVWSGAPGIIGRSQAMHSLVEQIDKLAKSDLSILFIGETGTGKEVAARRLHTMSGRKGPLVSVNCGAIPRELMEAQLFGHKKGAFTGASEDAAGYFASARSGTLFLDELGELPAELQPKFLRVLENGEFFPVGGTQAQKTDARIVSATNADLSGAIAAGRFRRDLFARLGGFTLHTPALRDRPEDIFELASAFLADAAPGVKFEWTAQFVEGLLLHGWPMNVRELRTVMQRVAALREPSLGKELLGRVLQQLPGVKQTSSKARDETIGRAELETALSECEGNVSKVAARFGKNPKQIYRWLEKHELDAAAFRRK